MPLWRGCARCSTRRGWAARVCVLGGISGCCSSDLYASRLGRPSLRPGRYFRLLFIGYFEGLSSERGIAWRVADSLSCGLSWTWT